MLKWILIIGGGLVALILLMTGVGALLPQGHVASVSATLSAPQDTVWRAIREVGAYPEWWPQISSAQRSPAADREIWNLLDKRSQPLPIEIVSSEPPARLHTRIAADDLPFGGTWTYVLEPTAAGATTVTVTEDGEVYNPFFRFMSRFVFGHYSSIESFLEALAAHLDQPATITRV